MKKQKAFTLIELMIAMAIIAILATAGISAYTGYVKKSRDTARAEIAQNLNTAVMSYAASNGGNPPADYNAFQAFLASAGETFGGGVSGTTLVVDPVGGKDVCLNADKKATEPCRFDYTAYSDGTYAISYGVESESSMEGNFYKTTRSVLADNATDGNTVQDKYGVYIGSAPFIGSTPTMSNTQPNNTPTVGADVSYTPIGATDPISMVATPLFLARRIDAPTVTSDGGDSGGGTGIAANDPCTLGDQCATGSECSAISNTCKKICGSGTIRARDDRCWYTTNLGGDSAFYQWGRNNTALTYSPNFPYDWSNPPNNSLWTDTGGINNPCPSLSHVPSSGEWQALINAETAAGITDLINSTLALPKAGNINYDYNIDGSLSDSGTIGYYWSSSPSGSGASYLYFYSVGAYIGDDNHRANGLSVRCIQD